MFVTSVMQDHDDDKGRASVEANFENKRVKKGQLFAKKIKNAVMCCFCF